MLLNTCVSRKVASKVSPSTQMQPLKSVTPISYKFGTQLPTFLAIFVHLSTPPPLGELAPPHQHHHHHHHR